MSTGAVRSSPFRWNAGGWFGGQLGASLWILLLGFLLWLQGSAVGAAVLACGLAANAVGVGLWLGRSRLAVYPALQTLLGATGLLALAAFLLVDRWGPTAGSDSPLASTPLWSLLVYPGLMLAIHLQERAARRRRAA